MHYRTLSQCDIPVGTHKTSVTEDTEAVQDRTQAELGIEDPGQPWDTRHKAGHSGLTRRDTLPWARPVWVTMGAGQQQRGSDQEEVYPLRPSLFPNIPPFIRFIPVDGQVVFKVPPPEELQQMLWQVNIEMFFVFLNSL